MNTRKLRKKYVAGARRIVVKIGTNVIGGGSGPLDGARIDALSEQVACLMEEGRQVAVVSSGAIGTGMRQMGMHKRPGSLPALQAAAAVGQSGLVSRYDRSFRAHGLHAGQILLTRDDFDSRRRYLNAANTVRALFESGCVPVINENDTISTDEIQLGDNDLLAAFVTHLIRADLLVLLTSEPGLCGVPPFPPGVVVSDGDGAGSRFGRRIGIVKSIGEEITNMACGETSDGGTGGMPSKLEAVAVAVKAGEAAVIADGRFEGVLLELMGGADIGTLFLPSTRKLGSRKRWIRFSRRPRGVIEIDAGAASAIKDRGGSLLPTGVTGVKGDFARGDTVSVCGAGGGEVARGLSNYSTEEITKIKGCSTGELSDILGRDYFDEVIHRDNMAIL